MEELSALHLGRFSVGGVSVTFASERDRDVLLDPQLQPFHAPSAISDIQIRIKWVPEVLALEIRPLFDSGTTWRLRKRDDSFTFDFEDASFGEQPFKRLIVNNKFSCGTLEMNQQYFCGSCPNVSPLGYPLDELLIMHRLTQEKAIELHGTGIVRPNGDANLFVGHSGAGKSTTTRLWTAIEEVEVLSDDRIIVRRDEETHRETPLGSGITPLGTAGSAKDHRVLRPRDRSALPTGHFAQDDKPRTKMRMYGTPWHGEAMFASPNSAPLTRIFVLEHGHGNVITCLSPSQAVAELFARSFVPFHRHEYVDSALAFLEELVDAIPVYRYAFEPDQHAVDKIRHFHD